MNSILFNQNFKFTFNYKLFFYLLFIIFFQITTYLHSQDYEFEEGMEYYKEKNNIEAIKYFDLSIWKNPDLDSAYLYRGICYAELDSLEKALCDLKEYVSRKPSDYVGRIWLGIIYKGMNQIDEAIENFKFGLDSGVKHMHYALGLCYFEKGLYELAISEFDSSVSYYIEESDSYYHIGICYYIKNNLDSACKYLGFSRECNNYFAEKLMCNICDSLDIINSISKGYIAEGLNFMYKGKYDAAIIRFLFSLDYSKEFPDAIYFIGKCHYYKDNYDSAIKYFTEAICLSSSQNYYTYRGICYYQKMQEYNNKKNNQLETLYRNYAIKDFEICNSMDTTDYFGYSYLGWTYFFNNFDVNKSYKYFMIANKLKNNDIDVMVGLVLSAYLNGFEKESKRYYDKICDLEPGFKNNKKGLEFLEDKMGYIYNKFEKSVFEKMYSNLSNR
jgi:tetratricopeptide (TPR) repeat protein